MLFSCYFQDLKSLILNILKEKLTSEISCLVGSFSSKPLKGFSTVETAMIKFWSKFQIQNLSYSFTRDESFLLPLSSKSPKENPFSRISRHISIRLSVYLFRDFQL